MGIRPVNLPPACCEFLGGVFKVIDTIDFRLEEKAKELFFYAGLL